MKPGKEENKVERPSITVPTVLTLGYVGAGKTSLLQAIFGTGIVPDGRIGHGAPTTQDFDSYEDAGIHIYDSKGLEPGEDVERQFLTRADSFINSLRNSPNAAHHVHLVWYCIDGTRARVTVCDLNLISRWKHVLVLITKSDITRPDQYQAVSKALQDHGIPAEDILPCSIDAPHQLRHLRERTLELLPAASKAALRSCMRLTLTANFAEHTRRVWSVAFSPTFGFLASAGKDNKVVIRAVNEEGIPLDRVVFETASDVNCVRFSPDGHFLAYGDDEGFVWLRTNAGKGGKRGAIVTGSMRGWRSDLYVRQQLKNYCYSVAFHPSRPLLAAGTKANAAVVFEYSLTSENLSMSRLWTFATDNDVNSVAFSCDGSSLLFADDDGKLHQAALQGRWPDRTAWKLSNDWIRSMDTHPNRPVAVLGGTDRVIRVVDVGQGGVFLRTLKRRGEVWCVRFSRCGELIYFSDGAGTVGVWEWESGKLILDRLNDKPGDPVYAVDSSPDGRFVASGSWDNTVRLWCLPQ